MSSYLLFSERVTKSIAEKANYQKINFDMNVDNTACLLVINEGGDVVTEQLSAEITDSFRNNPDGLADVIINIVTADTNYH